MCGRISENYDVLLNKILERCKNIENIEELEDLVNDYITQLRKNREFEYIEVNNNKEELIKFEESIFEHEEYQKKLIFNNEYTINNKENYHSILKIQDQILKINLELEALKKEQERRNMVLNCNDNIVTNLLDEDIDEIEGEDICEIIDFETNHTNSNLNMNVSKESKVTKKRKTHRRYFRRKNTNYKDKNEVDETEKILRSRTPLDIISLSSRFYLKELQFNNSKEFDNLQLPIAQDFKRGPYLNISMKNIRNIKALNLMNSSTSGNNGLFLKDLCRCYQLTQVRYIKRSSETESILINVPYETSIINENIKSNPNNIFNGVQFLIDDHNHKKEDEDHSQFDFNYFYSNQFSNYDSNSHSDHNSHNYGYLASVIENTSHAFKLARQRLKISVLPNCVKELDKLIDSDVEILKNFKIRFINKNRMDCQRKIKEKNIGNNRSNYEKKFNKSDTDKFTINNCIDIFEINNKEKLESLELLKEDIQHEINIFNDKLFDRNKLPFLISTLNYLSDEIELLENHTDYQKYNFIEIYQDDIVINNDIQDHIEIILSIPENIPLIPYYTSLCYPQSNENQSTNMNLINLLKPINGDFYHPINLFGYSKKINKVRKYISTKRIRLKNEFNKLKRFLPILYKFYRRYVINKEIQNSDKNIDFTWGCLPLRAIDHPDQVVPLPIGYFKHEFRYKAYHKFLDLLPQYRISDFNKVLRMSLSKIKIPLLFNLSNHISVLNNNSMIYYNSQNDHDNVEFNINDHIDSQIQDINNEPDVNLLSNNNRKNITNFNKESKVTVNTNNLRKKRGTGLNNNINIKNKRTRNSSEQVTLINNGEDKASSASSLLDSNDHFLTNTLNSNESLSNYNSRNTSINSKNSNIIGNTSKDKDKEINTNIMKNREREKGIVHQKQVQREWMQTTNSSSSLIGPSPLWFENCIFKFPAEIEYSIYEKDSLISFSNSYVNHNNLIKDIKDLDRNANLIWTYHEIRIFIEKYLMYPKDFRRIASFMEYKSIKDCIDFYYKYKYTFGFKRILRLVYYFKGQNKNQNILNDSSLNLEETLLDVNKGMTQGVEIHLNESSDNKDICTEVQHRNEELQKSSFDKYKNQEYSHQSDDNKIWNSIGDTSTYIEIITHKKHSYRELLIDEMLKTLNVDSTYNIFMKSIYNKCCFGNLTNMNIYNERILSRASLKRMLKIPSTLFKLPILELIEKNQNQNKNINIKWTKYDDLIYKFLFRIQDENYYINSNKRYIMDNLSNGYILPKNIDALISPLYNINIQNYSSDLITQIPSNIPIIFDKNSYDHETLLKSIVDPKISIHQLKIATFLYLNQFVENNTLLNNLTISPSNKQDLSLYSNIYNGLSNSPTNSHVNRAQINTFNNQEINSNSIYNEKPKTRRKRAISNIKDKDHINNYNIESSKSKIIKYNNKIENDSNVDSYNKENGLLETNNNQINTFNNLALPLLSNPLNSYCINNSNSSQYSNNNVSSNYDNNINNGFSDNSHQNWSNILMNQYLQQQILFQQTIEEQFRNAHQNAHLINNNSINQLNPLVTTTLLNNMQSSPNSLQLNIPHPSHIKQSLNQNNNIVNTSNNINNNLVGSINDNDTINNDNDNNNNTNSINRNNIDNNNINNNINISNQTQPQIFQNFLQIQQILQQQLQMQQQSPLQLQQLQLQQLQNQLQPLQFQQQFQLQQLQNQLQPMQQFLQNTNSNNPMSLLYQQISRNPNDTLNCFLQQQLISNSLNAMINNNSANIKLNLNKTNDINNKVFDNIKNNIDNNKHNKVNRITINDNQNNKMNDSNNKNDNNSTDNNNNGVVNNFSNSNNAVFNGFLQDTNKNLNNLNNNDNADQTINEPFPSSLDENKST